MLFSYIRAVWSFFWSRFSSSKDAVLPILPHDLTDVLDLDIELTPTTADWTLDTDPLPSPPRSEFKNPEVQKTLNQHRHLFKIITPIKVDRFEFLLSTHPNRRFVESVLKGLREGFWPYANTGWDSNYPTSLDLRHSFRQAPPGEDEAIFLRNHLHNERSKERFSPTFGSNILSGMYATTPVSVVPKKEPGKYRLINNQSFGQAFSLNSMVQRADIPTPPLDRLTQLTEWMTVLRKMHPNEKLTIWKSDIAEAYRNIPMHPLWQIKQVVFIDGKGYVDRCNAFGGTASGAIFIAVNSLIAWIAKHRKGIKFMGTYVDDSFGCCLASDKKYYAKYKADLPRDQALLLELWDEIGIPHKLEKQLHGPRLTVIGFDVDSKNMSIKLPDKSRADLLKELDTWCRGGGKPARSWVQFGGWLNWALDVYPLQRPALNSFYAALGPHNHRNSKAIVEVPDAVKEDLRWAKNHMKRSKGILFMKTHLWRPEDATVVIYTATSSKGMGFWYHKSGHGFYSEHTLRVAEHPKFYAGALCVLSALYDATLNGKNERILIFTDNAYVAALFTTLRAHKSPGNNFLLKAAVDVVTKGQHSFHVESREGDKQFGVACALSRLDLHQARRMSPGSIWKFNPWTWEKDMWGNEKFLAPNAPRGEVYKRK